MGKDLKLYHIKWEIDVEADSPEEAAKLALDIQLDRRAVATVFIVNSQHVIDVEDYKTQKVRNINKKFNKCFPTLVMH